MHIQRFNYAELQDFRYPLGAQPSKKVEKPPVVEEEAPPPPPPPPTFSLEELEAAKKMAHEQGRQMGLREGMEQAQNDQSQRLKRIEAVCGGLVSQAATLDNTLHQYIEQTSANVNDLVMILARKVAGDIVNTIPAASIEAMIDECMGILITQPKVTLTVHPDLGNQMSDILRDRLMKSGARTEMAVVADHDFELSEGRIEWKNGGIERDNDAIWAQIAARLKTINFAAILNLQPSVVPMRETPYGHDDSQNQQQAEMEPSVSYHADGDGEIHTADPLNGEIIADNETIPHTTAEKTDKITTINVDEPSDKGDES